MYSILYMGENIMIYNTIVINNNTQNREADFPATLEKHYANPSIWILLLLWTLLILLFSMQKTAGANFTC